MTGFFYFTEKCLRHTDALGRKDSVIFTAYKLRRFLHGFSSRIQNLKRGQLGYGFLRPINRAGPPNVDQTVIK